MKRRGADRQKRTVAVHYRGRREGQTGQRLLATCVCVCLLLGAVCAFVLPGVRFSAYLFAALAGVCALTILLRSWAARSARGQVFRRIFQILLTACLLIFLCTEGYLIRVGRQENSALPADAVIVLGAGVNGTIPSLVLQSRIDAAATYLTAHPGIPAVLSGGQGRGEEVSEGRAMYSALVKKGIAPSRLWLEEDSVTTAENLNYSAQRLRDAGVDTNAALVAVVTSDFHVVRASLLAQTAGLRTLMISGRTTWWWLNANYYVREFFAIGKMLALKVIG